MKSHIVGGLWFGKEGSTIYSVTYASCGVVGLRPVPYRYYGVPYLVYQTPIFAYPQWALSIAAISWR
jgi:hypothetical protein